VRALVRFFRNDVDCANCKDCKANKALDCKLKKTRILRNRNHNQQTDECYCILRHSISFQSISPYTVIFIKRQQGKQKKGAFEAPFSCVLYEVALHIEINIGPVFGICLVCASVL